MTTVIVSIHSQDGITTEIVGRGTGIINAERKPRIGTPGGMGFGGGEILSLAAGTCFYNNLRRLANDKGITLKTIEVNVTAETSDDEPRVESDASKEEIAALTTQALQGSYVADMLTHSVSVNLSSADI